MFFKKYLRKALQIQFFLLTLPPSGRLHIIQPPWESNFFCRLGLF